MLKEPFLANAALDKIEAQLPKFITKKIKDKFAVATIKHYLKTIRRALRIAAKRKITSSMPAIELLSGENQREFTLSREMEPTFLKHAAGELDGQLLRLLLLDLHTGLRRKELLTLKRVDVHLEPVGKAQRGYVHVRGTKSRNSKRNLSLTAAAREALIEQLAFRRNSEYLFVSSADPREPMSPKTLSDAFIRVRKAAKLPEEFVLHSLRHSFGTRLGEAGVDAFTIMRLMGHSSITMTQRYVHPTPATTENAFQAMEDMSAVLEAIAATAPHFCDH